MNVLPAAGAFLLRRISEYYEDATYAPEEVALLVDELDRVRALVREDAELTDLIEAAVRLATEALHLGSGLVAIAD